MASVPFLGTKDHILIQDMELLDKIESVEKDGSLESINPYSKS